MLQLAVQWASLLTGIGVILLIADRVFGVVRRDVKTTDAIAELEKHLKELDLRVAGFVSAVTANAELGLRVSIRTEAHEERLKAIEAIRDAFLRHASKDEAEHTAMQNSIERLSRVNENLSAQISRMIPADVFAEVSSARHKGT